MWLRDFLPERKAIKETARMFLHGYYSRIEGSTSTASVGDYAKRILLLLSETRKQKVGMGFSTNLASRGSDLRWIGKYEAIDICMSFFGWIDC